MIHLARITTYIFICSLVLSSIGLSKQQEKIINFDGYGAMKIGMRLKEGESHGMKFNVPEVEEYDCLDEVTAKNFSDLQIHINPEDRGSHTVIGAIIVLSPAYKTPEGAKLGDSVQKVKHLYADRFETVKGRLLMSPFGSHGKDWDNDKGYFMDIYNADKERLIRFHTDGEKIDALYVGRPYDVRMIGGCN